MLGSGYNWVNVKIPGSVVFWLPTTSSSEMNHPLYQDRSDWWTLGGPAGPDHPIIFRDTMILSGDHLSRVFDCIQSCIIMREMWSESWAPTPLHSQLSAEWSVPVASLHTLSAHHPGPTKMSHSDTSLTDWLSVCLSGFLRTRVNPSKS